MMRSLSSAVAGLRTHQTKMDVIGNNIANVNTYGFKASRTTFQDVYYQNLSSGSRAQGAVSGGTNPTQIGYGSSVATIDLLITQSGSASTDRALDVYIQGDGFLTAMDSSGNLIYTRLGNLRFDGEGNLVDGAGNLIQGFPMGPDGKPIISSDGTITASELQSISCDPEVLDRLTGIMISPTGAIIGILPGDAEMKAATNLKFIDPGSIRIPTDSVYSGDVRMVVGALPTAGTLQTALGLGANTITSVDFGDKGLNPVAGYTISVSSSGEVTFTEPASGGNPGVSYTGYVKDGVLELKSKSGKVAMVINFAEDNPTLPTTPTPAPEVDLTGLPLVFEITTTDKGGNIVKLPKRDENDPPVQLTQGALDALDGITMSLSIPVGDIVAQDAFSLGKAATAEGERLPIGNLVLAKFRNAAGLEGVGGGYMGETFNSGEPIFVRPSLEGTGSLQSGYLEMSNVDLSKEFTEMITTQRGFQANSRIVSVSDEMLQELVNLKR